jgi:hypothetical protein
MLFADAAADAVTAAIAASAVAATQQALNALYSALAGVLVIVALILQTWYQDYRLRMAAKRLEAAATKEAQSVKVKLENLADVTTDTNETGKTVAKAINGQTTDLLRQAAKSLRHVATLTRKPSDDTTATVAETALERHEKKGDSGILK